MNRPQVKIRSCEPSRSAFGGAALLAWLQLSFASPASAISGYPVTWYLMWGEEGDAPGQFIDPFGICNSSNGFVYVTDPQLCRIQKFDGFGQFFIAWGSEGTGPSQFRQPEDVEEGPDGLIYVADSRNRRIQKFTPEGGFVALWETPTPGPPADRARGIAFDSHGIVYVAFGAPGRVEKYTSDGKYLTQWDIPGNAYSDGGALGIAIDAQDEVYVVDPTASWSGVRKFDLDGNLLQEWGGSGSGPGQFYTAIDVAIDNQGRAFVTDLNNSRVQVFSNFGTYLGEWGTPGTATGQFNKPRGITVDSSIFIFVVDGGNTRVQKFGFGTVSVAPFSWGRIKSLYR